jgi:hypothetical protein
MCKLIHAPFPVDTHSVNCAWLECGHLRRTPAQCVRRCGKYFLLSVLITGEKSSLNAVTNQCIASFYLFYRRNIENAYGREVEQLRKEYSQEDKELIEKCLEAKRIFNLKLESLVQELEEKGRLIS